MILICYLKGMVKKCIHKLENVELFYIKNIINDMSVLDSADRCRENGKDDRKKNYMKYSM